MSYLLQYARRPDLIAPRTSAARVDEYARLNQPGLYGDAFVRVFVEDTARRRREASLQSNESCAAGKSARGPERAGSRLFIEATGTRQHDRELYPHQHR